MNTYFTKKDIWVVNKHIQISSASLGIREMQINPQKNTTLRLLVKWLKFKILTISYVRKDVEEMKLK